MSHISRAFRSEIRILGVSSSKSRQNQTTTNTESDNVNNRGVNESVKKGRPKLERRGGRRPGAMKFPLRSATKQYLEMREDRVKRSTLNNETRILWHLVGILEDLAKKGEISTCNPWKMGRREIRAFLDHLRDGDHSLKNETLEKYIRYFEGVLEYCENRVIQEMKKDSPNLFPKRSRNPIAYLSDDKLKAIQECASKFDGWKGEVMRFMTVFYPATGLRPSELRLAHIDDIDIQEMTLLVRHPKGEDSYGGKRTVTILEEADEATLRFIEKRKEHILEMGFTESKYLIPNLSSGKDMPYSSNHFRELKKELQEATKIQFKIKDFRSTFACRIIKKDPTLLPAVSRQLGHGSIGVTERFYADMNLIDARSKLRKALVNENEAILRKESLRPEIVENNSGTHLRTLIKQKEYLPGYA